MNEAEKDEYSKYLREQLNNAVKIWDTETIKHLVLVKRVSVDTAITNNSRCLLTEASLKGDVDMARFSLENGADPDNMGWKERGALYHAMQSGHCDIVELLGEYNVFPFPQDYKWRETPLHYIHHYSKDENGSFNNIL